MPAPALRLLTGVLLSAFSLAAAPHASAQTAAAASVQPRNDYADGKTWLCRPGRQDACAVNEDATVVHTDGSTKLEPFKAAEDPRVDCFYVYPTVSRDPTPNSDMNAGPEELQVIKQQFARFASVCRPYAPLYRQVTLTALTATMLGKPMQADRALGYNDVKDAWDYYLAHDNKGRGVVLIGHSQGSGVLIELVKHEVDGKPVQKQILSVITAGARLQVPVGKGVGGDFKSIPLCKTFGQTGCAINFASFRASSPPPANTRFGLSSGPSLEAACVNPAALAGGSGRLHAYLPSGTEAIVAADAQKARPWTTPPTAITTPFVEVPGLLSAECAKNEHGTYLSISINAETGKRTNEISGDVVVGGSVLKDWGLHLIDMNLAMGNLISDVRAQAKTYLGAGK